MFNIKKARMVDVLLGAGFNQKKVFTVLGFPKCTGIRLEKDSILPDTIDLDIYTISGHEKKTLVASKILPIKDINPVVSWLDIGSNRIINFYFDKGASVKLVCSNKVSIPMPAGMPTPKSIKPRYPKVAANQS